MNGVLVPTVTSAGGVHLLMGVDGPLPCGLRRWRVRRIRWRAPRELTCPICRLVVEGARLSLVAEPHEALHAPIWYTELDRPTLPAEA